MSETMPIHVLAHDTVSKLAAGEVVDRPASVVRELLDNAIDAGATAISVHITGGGTNLIKVVDNGSGMERADLLVCAERHCTSKISGIDDLMSLTSLGYRGEALHAIASVSRLRVQSRPRGGVGAQVEYEGTERIREGAVGCPEGTAVEVRDLFFNTPARLKFIKGPVAEANRVEQVVRRFVVGYPGVSFTLEIEGREQVRSVGSGEIRDAVAAVYGWRVAERMAEVSAESAPVKVRGLVSPPQISKPNRSDIQMFVNGRRVHNPSLLYAVQEAYSSLLMAGRFPITVLYLNLPADQLDVNVHPQKSEVRFADERGVTSALNKAVRACLIRESGPPSKAEFTDAISQAAFDQPLQSLLQRGGGLTEPVEGGAVSARVDDPGQEAASAALPPLTVLGQLAATYIIAAGPQAMCLIDQHAAHERVLLERLQSSFREGGIEGQALLEPLVVPLSPLQAERAGAFAAELAAVGFEVEVFGGDALIVRSVPACVPHFEAGGLISELEQGLEGLATTEERQRAMLASMSCHGAIRAGQSLSMEEMRALIRDLGRTRVPTACAHGRPTILELSTADLEREFGRRGFRAG